MAETTINVQLRIGAKAEHIERLRRDIEEGKVSLLHRSLYAEIERGIRDMRTPPRTGRFFNE